MGEALFGISGKGWAVLCADRHMSYSIIEMFDNEDKISKINESTILACAGPCADRSQFTEYIKKNMKLYELRNEVSCDTAAIAHWTRKELAKSLRSRGAYQTDILVAGYDAESDSASLYFLDHMSAMTKLTKGAHGYGAYFCNGLMDRYYTPGMSEAEGIELIKRCIAELQTRFVGKLTKWKIKVVNKDGVREMDHE